MRDQAATADGRRPAAPAGDQRRRCAVIAAQQPHYRRIEPSLRSGSSPMPPGERLPSDAELCVEFGVSRMTAGNAMQRLAEDGLVTARARPRAASSPTPPAHRRANRLMTFSQEMRRAGRVPSSRVLTRVIRPSTRCGGRKRSGSRPRSRSSHLRRLRLADGEPIALETAVLVGATAPAVMTADLASRLAPRGARPRPGSSLRRGTGTIAAAAATAEDARLLEHPAGRPAPRRAARHRRRPRTADRGDRVALPARTGTRSTSRFDVEPRRPTPRPTRGRRRPVTAADDRRGRLVLDDGVADGRITVEDGRIVAVEVDRRRRPPSAPPTARSSPRASSTSTSTAGAATTRWATATALDGMARAPAPPRRDVVPADRP